MDALGQVHISTVANFPIVFWVLRRVFVGNLDSVNDASPLGDRLIVRILEACEGVYITS